MKKYPLRGDWTVTAKMLKVFGTEGTAGGKGTFLGKGGQPLMIAKRPELRGKKPSVGVAGGPGAWQAQGSSVKSSSSHEPGRKGVAALGWV